MFARWPLPEQGRWLRATVLGGVALLPLALWIGVVRLRFGPAAEGGGGNFTLPLAGFAEKSAELLVGLAEEGGRPEHVLGLLTVFSPLVPTGRRALLLLVAGNLSVAAGLARFDPPPREFHRVEGTGSLHARVGEGLRLTVDLDRAWQPVETRSFEIPPAAVLSLVWRTNRPGDFPGASDFRALTFALREVRIQARPTKRDAP
jgi:hypothetical protein